MVLTGTRLHTGSSEAELPIRVWFGLKGGRVIDGGRRTVLLTHTAVIEVTTSLQRGRTLNGPRKKQTNTKQNKTKPGQFLCNLPDSRSLWVRCIQQHTACGSSHWEESLCIAGSPTHSYYGSLWRKKTSPDFQLFFNQTEFLSASYGNSQVWQSCAAFPQQLVKHSEEQLGPAATGKAQ